METKMLEEFENHCAILRKAIDNNNPMKELIERRTLHIRTFISRCGIKESDIEAIESKFNL